MIFLLLEMCKCKTDGELKFNSLIFIVQRVNYDCCVIYYIIVVCFNLRSASVGMAVA